MGVSEMEHVGRDDLDMLQSIYKAAAHDLPPGRNYAIIQFRYKAGQWPTRRWRLQRENFSVGSLQEALVALFTRRVPANITIYVNMTNDDYVEAYNSYVFLVKVGRYLSLSGMPRNDWFFAREPDYDNNGPRFHAYQNDAKTLPFELWLWDGEGKEEKLRPLYGSDNPVTFASVSLYEYHFMAALLYERNERDRLKKLQYGFDVAYPARFQQLAGGDSDWVVDVKLRGDSSTFGGSSIRPAPGTEVKLYVKNQSISHDAKTAFCGKVHALKADGYDLKVIAPKALDVRIDDGDCADVHVIWQFDDPDLARKMQAVQDACRTARTQITPALVGSSVPGRTTGRFSIRSIMIDPEMESWSPDLFREMISEYSNDEVPVQTAESDAANLPHAYDLNHEQREVFDAAMHGTPGNTLLVEGVPGSGKSTTLSLLSSSVSSM